MDEKGYRYGLGLVFLYIIFRIIIIPSYKYFTGALHPFALDVYIIFAGVVAFGIMCRFRLRRFISLGREEKKGFFLVYIPAVVGALLLDLALFYLPVKTYAIFSALLPIIVSFYSILILKEHPTKYLWIAALAAVVGAIIFKSATAFQVGWGELAVIAGILLFGFLPITNRKYVSKIGAGELLFLSSSIALVSASALAFSLGVFSLPPQDPTYLSLLFVYFFVWGAAALVSAKSFHYLPAYISPILTTALVPLGAAIAGILVFGESLGTSEIVGGTVMIGAAVLASWKRDKQQKN